MKATGCILVLATITSLAQAGVYNTTSSTVDAGGTAASSASYSQSAGSIGGIVGVSSQTATQETAKNGYVGQLTEVAGMQLTTAPASVNEASTRQLTAAQVLDDATTAVLDPASVAWSVLTGPVTSVSASGLATAGTIYQTTPASVQGIWGGFTATQGLSVINVGVDDYQAYAGDGIDDDWQVQYFGLPPNANAGPNADPDGDGQKNLLEFLAGVAPNNPSSRFLLHIEPVAGQPAQKKLVFPFIAARTYTVESNTNLDVTWTPLSGATTSDNGGERSITDPNASGAKKFYRLNITKP